MKEIINEYGEYMVSFLTAIGVVSCLFILMNILKSSFEVFVDALC